LGGGKARRSRGSSDKICIISIENVVAARHSEGSGAPKIYSFDGDTRQVFSPEVWEDLRLWQTRCLVAHVPSFSSGLSKCVGCVWLLSGVATDNKWLAGGRLGQIHYNL